MSTNQANKDIQTVMRREGETLKGRGSEEGLSV